MEIPSLPVRLIGCSGSGGHAGHGRKPNGKERRELRDNNYYQPYSSSRPGSALCSIKSNGKIGSSQRPRSAASTHTSKQLMKTFKSVAAYEEMLTQRMQAELFKRQTRWSSEREVFNRIQSEEEYVRRAKVDKRLRIRREIVTLKHQIIFEREQHEDAEWHERSNIDSSCSFTLKEILLQCKGGARKISVKETMVAHQMQQSFERLEISVEELSSREVSSRRTLIRINLLELTQVGEAERAVTMALQREAEIARRFRAEREHQMNRLLNGETSERESATSGEIWEFIQIEKEHAAWQEAMRLEEERRRESFRQMLQEQDAVFTKERLSMVTLESQKRPDIRVQEAEERLDLSRAEVESKQQTLLSEEERRTRETAALREQQEAERQPIIRSETDDRMTLVDEVYGGLQSLWSKYQKGSLEIMKPITLRSRSFSPFLDGNDDVRIAAGAVFEMKRKFNPYISSKLVKLTIDVGIVDGYCEGDNLMILANSSIIRTTGYSLIRIVGGTFTAIRQIAFIKGRSSTAGPFPDPISIEEGCVPFTHTDGSLDSENNRWLRIELNFPKDRDPFKDTEWLLRQIRFKKPRKEWNPQVEDATKRTIVIRVVAALTPNAADISRGKRLVSCTVAHEISIEPLPPIFFLNTTSRHIRYELSKERVREGKRTAMKVMPTLLSYHPERSASHGILTVEITEPDVEGDQLLLRGHDLDIKHIQGRHRRTIIQKQGQELAEFIVGTLDPNSEQRCSFIKLKFAPEVSQWKVGEVIRSLRYSSQAQQPHRLRRRIKVQFTEAVPPWCSATAVCFINLQYPEDIGPCYIHLSQGISHCIVWRASASQSDTPYSKYVEPVITPIAPEGVIQNQHSLGCPEVGATLFKGGTLSFRIEQGVQSGDTLLLQPKAGVIATEVIESNSSQQTVSVRGRTIARMVSEVGGAHGSGTYEGATSVAWLRIEFTQQVAEIEICSIVQSICFTNNGPTHAGVRWITATFVACDPLMPSAPTAKSRVGVRVCLPIMTTPSRFCSQKYIENEGRRRFGQFELPEPVFKDDDIIAVFDGGSVTVEIMEGIDPEDCLGLCETMGKDYEIIPLKQEGLNTVVLQGANKHFAIYTPHQVGTAGFSIRLGRAADRRKTVDTSLKKAHACRVRKKELLLLLRNIFFCNESDDPTTLKKVLRTTVTDSFGASSQVIVELSIQPINDKTQVVLPTTKLAYRQGSRKDYRGFQLCAGCELVDPDTAELREGFMSVELFGGGGKNDRLGIMTPEQQQQLNESNDTQSAIVELLPTDSNSSEVLIGGHSVGSVEFKGGQRGAGSLHFSIALESKWPGWDKLPNTLTAHSSSWSPSKDGSRTPKHRISSVSSQSGGRRFSLSDSPRRNPLMIVTKEAIGVWGPPKLIKILPRQSSDHMEAPVNKNARRASRMRSQSRGKRGSISAEAPPVKYGLPLEAASCLLRTVIYCNTSSGTLLKSGPRTYLLKVNAGDDVGDTKVKITVDASPPLVSIPAAIPAVFKYLEGSDFQSVCSKVVIGLSPKIAFRRGWLSLSFVGGFIADEDQLSFQDPSGEYYITWAKDKPGQGQIFVDSRLEKRVLTSGNQNSYLLGSITETVQEITVQFENNCVTTGKHVSHLLKCLCYRNVSLTPTSWVTRRMDLQVLWGSPDLPLEKSGKVEIDSPNYDHCSLSLGIEVEPFDNPTEVILPITQLHFTAGVTGYEPVPLFIAPGAEARDPDTPIFLPSSEVSVEVLGGSRNDVLDLSPTPPHSEIDNMNITNGAVVLSQSRVATIRRVVHQPFKLWLDLHNCPVEAIAPMLRRLVYRHLGAPKRIFKKNIQISVKTASGSYEQSIPTRVKMFVNVIPSPIEYMSQPVLVQRGKLPLILLPSSTKVNSISGVEFKFEVIRLSATTRRSNHITATTSGEEAAVPRAFWLPFESLEWLPSLRAPIQSDCLRLGQLPPEYTVKVVATEGSDKNGPPTAVEIFVKEGKLGTVSTPRKDMYRLNGDRYTVSHELTLSLSSRTVLSGRTVIPVLRAIAYSCDGCFVDKATRDAQKNTKRRASVSFDDVDVPSPEGSPEVIVRMTTKIPVPKPQQFLVLVDHKIVRPHPDT